VENEVNQLVESLRNEGENVFWSKSLPECEGVLENVRLLVIDLYLGDEDTLGLDESYEMVAGIIKKTSEKSGFIIVAPWTKAAKNDESDNEILKKLNSLLDGFKGIILQPFGKEGVTQKELLKRLKDVITIDPKCSLILEVEKSVEIARNKTVSDIFSIGSISVVLKALEKEVGNTALSREVMDLYLKILGRHAKITDEIIECVSLTLKQDVEVDDEQYGLIHNLQSYFEVQPNNHIWTGDILEKDGEYIIVITPACDFAQAKDRPPEYIKAITAFRINHTDLVDSSKTLEIANKLKLKIKSREACTRAIFENRFLQERFYMLRYLKEELIQKEAQINKLYHLVLDFQQVKNVPFKITLMEVMRDSRWKPVCRIDDPIIEDLLHKYSAYSSRVGVQSIPSEVVAKIVGKTKK
jgi:hypothetical protein